MDDNNLFRPSETCNIPPTELANLKEWLKEKDYETLDQILVFDYLTELEERLNLYHLALLCGGSCIDDRRWKKINYSELRKNADEEQAEAKFISAANDSPSDSKKTISKLIPVSNLYKYDARSYNLETQDISTIKGEYLPYYQSMHLQQKSNVQPIPPAPTEGSYDHNYFSEDKLQQYYKAQEIASNQSEYLCPTETGRKQILLSVDLEHASDESLIKQFATLLPSLRAKLGIQEPTKNHNPHTKLGAVKKLLVYKAIQYLDLKLYCILKSPHNEEWHLTDLMLDKLLFNGETVSGAETLRQFRKDFYNPKLLNQTYINNLITNTRSNPDNAQLRMHRL